MTKELTLKTTLLMEAKQKTPIAMAIEKLNQCLIHNYGQSEYENGKDSAYNLAIEILTELIPTEREAFSKFGKEVYNKSRVSTGNEIVSFNIWWDTFLDEKFTQS